jgi:YVTN family beta-propeller protein
MMKLFRSALVGRGGLLAAAGLGLFLLSPVTWAQAPRPAVPRATSTALTGLLTLWYGSSSPYPGFILPFTSTLTGGSFGTSITDVGDEPYQMLQSGSTLYVLNDGSGTISVVDLLTGAVTSTIPLSYQGTTLDPFFGVLSPNGQDLYFVTDSGVDAYVLDLASGTVTTAIALSSPSGYTDIYPYDVALGPNGGHLYVAEYYGGTDEYGGVDQIDLATDQVVQNYNFYDYYHGTNDSSQVTQAGSYEVFYPYSVTVSPDGSTLYVVATTYYKNTTEEPVLLTIDTTSGILENVIPDTSVVDYGEGYAVVDDAQGPWVYATDYYGTNVIAYDSATGQSQLIPTGFSDPYALALTDGGNRLVVGSYSPSSSNPALVVIDTNPASASFNTVVGTVDAPAAENGDILTWLLYFSPLSAVSTSLDEAVGDVSGNLSTEVTNNTGCPLSYAVVTPPTTGGFDLDAETGQWTYTPALAALTPSVSFTYSVSTSASCAVYGVQTATGTITIDWQPTIGPIPPVAVGSGETSGVESFQVYTPVPVTFTAASSDPTVVGAGDVLTSSPCTGYCTLAVRGGAPGEAEVTLLARTAAGATASGRFEVVVRAAGTGTSSGSGAMGPWALVLLALGALVEVMRRRRAGRI